MCARICPLLSVAPRKDISVLENRFERRRIPELQRIGRLHVVMPVDKNGATSGLMFVACPDNGMTARRNKLCLQTNAGESFHEPVRAFRHPFRVLVVSRNAWKAQERIKIFEVI